MKINFDGDRISPRDVARRLLHRKLEALAFWQEDWEESEREQEGLAGTPRPATDNQKAAIDKAVTALIRSVERRYKITHDAGTRRE